MQPKIADVTLLRLLEPNMYYFPDSGRVWMSPFLYKSLTTRETRVMSRRVPLDTGTID